MKDISTNQIQGFPKTRCPHPICQYHMIDGHLKCPQCHRQIEPVTDANIATEVALGGDGQNERDSILHGQGDQSFLVEHSASSGIDGLLRDMAN